MKHLIIYGKAWNGSKFMENHETFHNSWKSIKRFKIRGKGMKTIHGVFKLAVKHSNWFWISYCGQIVPNAELFFFKVKAIVSKVFHISNKIISNKVSKMFAESWNISFDKWGPRHVSNNVRTFSSPFAEFVTDSSRYSIDVSVRANRPDKLTSRFVIFSVSSIWNLNLDTSRGVARVSTKLWIPSPKESFCLIASS